MEEKKKKTSSKKSSATKKGAPKKNINKQATKSTTSKKTTGKKSANKVVKKATTRKSIEKKEIVEKIVEEKEVKQVPKKRVLEESIIHPENPEDAFERTMIFDGTTSKNIEDVISNLEREHIILKDKVIKRNPIKKYISIVLYLVIACIIVAASIYTITKYMDKNNSGSTLNNNVYEKIKEQNKQPVEEQEIEEGIYAHIIEISLSTFESKILNGENMDVLVFSSTCYGCAAAEPIIEKALEEENKVIYKIDIVKLSEEENALFRTYYAYKETPTIFTIRDGITKNDLVGSKTEEQIKKWIKENV